MNGFALVFMIGALTGILLSNVSLENPILDLLLGIGIYVGIYLITYYFMELKYK